MVDRVLCDDCRASGPALGAAAQVTPVAFHFGKNMSACRRWVWQEGKMEKFDKRFLGAGIAMGVGYGVATDNLAIGLALGVALGLAIGRWRGSKR